MSGMLDLETTGDPALDSILGGGIPARSMVLIAGEPGSGKTVLTLQLLFHAARHGRRCLFFTTLSEPSIKVLRYMQQFAFFDAELFASSITLHDLGASLRDGPAKTLERVESAVATHEPSLVVIDSFKVLGEQLQASAHGRAAIYDLAVQMAGWGATTLLVGEYGRSDVATYAEFAIADGIVALGAERHGLTAVRDIEVLKLRGAAPRMGKHFFDIDRRGIRCFPRVDVPHDLQDQLTASPAERAATGVAGLDELLGGGLPRSSATVVQGATGTGKTLLGLQFLIEGTRRGERGVLFTLEETPEQLRYAARSVGWDLEALEAADKLSIRYTSPVELSTDRFLQEARDEVRALGARRAVFDSLSTMVLSLPSERRFKELVYSITKYLRGAGVTLLLTAEATELLGPTQLAGHGASYMADNYIHIRYVEIEGRLERAISVIKARGISHSTELRMVAIGGGGISVVGGRFKDMRGVLTGLPSPDPGSRQDLGPRQDPKTR